MVLNFDSRAQARKRESLRQEIEIVLAAVACQSDFYNLVKEPLSRRGRALAEEKPEGEPWGVLPLLVCEAISARYEPAVPVAAALELFRAAADVFDDIEDQDSPDSLAAKYGIAKAANVATALLVLAERAIHRLEGKGIPSPSVVRIFGLINSKYTVACLGQHLDFSVGPRTNITEEEYLKIADMKSASAMECACHAGAIVATGEEDPVARLFAQWGHNLGMAYQIADDISGLTSGRDTRYQRITLPVIFALAHTEGLTKRRLWDWFNREMLTAQSVSTEEILNLLFASGGIEYALIKLEIYKNRARDILSEIRTAGVNTEDLKIF